MKERRQNNEMKYIHKIQLKEQLMQQFLKRKEEINRSSLDHRTRVKLNKMHMIQSKKESTLQMRNVSKLTLDLKHRMDE